jgi:hypothetical protein
VRRGLAATFGKEPLRQRWAAVKMADNVLSEPIMLIAYSIGWGRGIKMKEQIGTNIMTSM